MSCLLGRFECRLKELGQRMSYGGRVDRLLTRFGNSSCLAVLRLLFERIEIIERVGIAGEEFCSLCARACKFYVG